MDDKVRELLDRVRDTAVGAADAANQTARAAGKKAGQMVDVAKLNVQLFDLNGEFNDVLRQLGQVMYDTHRGQAQARICPACGAACGRDDQFCRRCGGSL